MAERRVAEPSAIPVTEASRFDWRGTGLDGALGTARASARDAVAAAMAGPAVPQPDATRAWGSAELAVQRCLALAIDRLTAGSQSEPRRLLEELSAQNPRASQLLTAALLAPDTRARYVFLEDLLAHLARPAISIGDNKCGVPRAAEPPADGAGQGPRPEK